MAASTMSATANFPFPVLTPIATDNTPPTHATLQVLQRQLNANAMAVHSHHGGGLHGHLALVVSPARYAILTNNAAPFPPPAAPPADAIIPAGATAAQIAEAVRTHAEDIRVFRCFHDTDKALVRAIMAATPTTYLDTIADPDLGYANISAIQILTHLFDTYGNLTPADRQANLTTMSRPWSPPASIESLFVQLETGQRFANNANEPIADSHLARMGYAIINQTGLFPDACREWRLLPDALQTWQPFKQHFARHERDRLELATTYTSGFTPTAHAICLPIATTEPAPNDLTINAVTKLPTGPEYAALLSELARLRLTATPRPAPPVTIARGYCWTHGSTSNHVHTSATCKNRADGHIETATWRNKCGGNPNAFVPASRRHQTTK
jgi:hypothetical protein